VALLIYPQNRTDAHDKFLCRFCQRLLLIVIQQSVFERTDVCFCVLMNGFAFYLADGLLKYNSDTFDGVDWIRGVWYAN
jgi:hypothetical protein